MAKPDPLRELLIEHEEGERIDAAVREQMRAEQQSRAVGRRNAKRLRIAWGTSIVSVSVWDAQSSDVEEEIAKAIKEFLRRYVNETDAASERRG